MFKRTVVPRAFTFLVKLARDVADISSLTWSVRTGSSTVVPSPPATLSVGLAATWGACKSLAGNTVVMRILAILACLTRSRLESDAKPPF